VTRDRTDNALAPAPEGAWAAAQRAAPIGWCAALAAAATLPTLGRQPLSWNEAVTLNAARRSPGQLWTLLQHTDAPLGLYYTLMHAWLTVLGWLGVGATSYVLRLPSALADIACVVIVVVVVSRAFDRATAILAGTILAVHPMMTFYAQDARPYALVVLSFVASTGVLTRPFGARRRRCC
jgi:mannosyltransferase